ncbi:MAG: PAS domain-containing protein [Elainellaceae cyanobacterium]
MTTRIMSFRVPEDLAQKIEHQAQHAGKSRTTIVLKALLQVFDQSSSSSQLTTSTTLPVQTLSDLEQQLKEWSVYLDRLQHEHRFNQGDMQRVIALKRAVNSLLEVNSDTSSLESPPVSDVQTRQQPITSMLPARDDACVADCHMVNTLGQILAVAADLVFVLDRAGRFTYLNPAGSWVFDLEPGQVLGKTWEQLGFATETAQSFAAQCDLAVCTAQPAYGEFQISITGCPRHYEYSLSAIKGDRGRVDSFVCMARDITKHKQVEAALLETEEKYRNLFESSSDAIFIIDTDTHQIIDANWSASRQLGYSRREILRLTLNDIESSMTPLRRKAIFRELDIKGSIIFEQVYRRKDGRNIAVEVNSRLIEYGDTIAIQNFVRDISDRKQAEAKIQELYAKRNQ